MSVWGMFSLGLMVPLVVAAVGAGRGDSIGRCVAVQLLSSLATLILIALSFAMGQSFSIDLPLAVGLLSLPAVLLMALFLERWL